MKKIGLLICIIAIVFVFPATAFAGVQAEIIRAFVTDDVLYTYVDITGAEKAITKAEAKIGTGVYPATDSMLTVRQAGSPVRYMLLIDGSTSMGGYKDEIVSFTEELSALSGENTSFYLAKFGEKLTINDEDIAADSIVSEVENLKFDEHATKLHDCINESLDYFEAMPRKGNELRCMIIISDAVEYNPQGGMSFDDIQKRIESSDAMLYGVGLGKNDDALEKLDVLVEASGGNSWELKSTDLSSKIAEEIVEYSSDLYVTGFDISGCEASSESESISVTFSSGSELICRAERSVMIPELNADETANEDNPPTQLPEEPEDSEQGNPYSSEDTISDTNDSQNTPIGLIVGICAAGIVVAVIITLLLKKKNKTGSGIFVKIEVIEGNYAGKTTEFILNNELLVGNSKKCAIKFNDDTLLECNTRVFFAGDRIYVEDMGSQQGTSVNGIIINMPNVLRSGDVISSGNIAFKIKF